jgi:hypothetical protein
MILDGGALSLAMFGERLDPRQYLTRMYPGAPVPALNQVVATAAPLTARVNHGIWIASCDCGAPRDKIPTPGGGVWLDAPMIWCLRCQNGGTGRGWRPVAVTDEQTRARIEAVLLCRPNVEDRNWEPSETVADLIAQNAAHGDPVPDRIADAVLGPVHGPTWQETVTPFSATPRRALGPRWWQRLRLGVGGR